MLNLPEQCPINISLDTLDECSNLMGMLSAHEEVLKLIEEPVNLKLSILKCTFPWASQPEMDIWVVFDPLITLKISLYDQAGGKYNIAKYIKYIVNSDSKMQRWNENNKHFVVVTLMTTWMACKSSNICPLSYASLWQWAFKYQWFCRFGWIVCQVDRLHCTLPGSSCEYSIGLEQLAEDIVWNLQPHSAGN